MLRNKIKNLTLVSIFLTMSCAISNEPTWVVSIDPVPPSDYYCKYKQGIEVDGKPIPCPPAKQHDLKRFCSRGGVGKTNNHWKVSSEIRTLVDKKLEKIFIRQNNPLQSLELNGFSNLSANSNLNASFNFSGFSDFNLYARQYLGFHSDGIKKIYINAYKISNNIKISDRHQFMGHSCHGGKNFWGIVYDIEKQKFESLSFNNFGPPVRAKQ